MTLRRPVAALALLLAAAAAHAGDDNPPGNAPAQQPPAPPAAADDPEIAAATAEYERLLGTKLAVVVRGPFVIRGDNTVPDLTRIAEACDRTLNHFLQVVGGGPDDVFPPLRKGATGGAGVGVRVEVFQFVREKQYLALLDKVIARIRDDTVDDRRLALMKRQRGFMIQSPRYLFAQYQGPSEMASCISQASHKTSHLCLLSWNRVGGWNPWWLLEGFAAWQELALYKESRTYCLDVDRPGDYAKAGTPEADEAAKARMEDAWRQKVKAMIRGGRQLRWQTLAKRSLNELVYDDVVQSWSIVDWLYKTRKLEQFVRQSKEKRGDLEATCGAVFAKQAGVAEIDWETWALR